MKDATVGILALQGDVGEHYSAVAAAGFEPVLVRKAAQLERCSALVIPGGESTTISNLMLEGGIFDAVKSMEAEGKPILGTCAGAILLAKDAGRQQKQSGQRLLGLMDMEVNRNAFGRQRESFEADVDIEEAGLRAMSVPFIRSPVITKVRGGCRAVSMMEGKIVAARQGNVTAACFHPELSADEDKRSRFLRWALNSGGRTTARH